MVKRNLLWLAPAGIVILGGCGTLEHQTAESPPTTVAWYYTGADGLTYNKPNPNPSMRDQVDPRTCRYVDGHTVNSEPVTCRSSVLILGPGGSPAPPTSTQAASSTTASGPVP